MSKIGKQPIAIPEGISVEINDGVLKMRGPKGELEAPIASHVKASFENSTLQFEKADDSRDAQALWGTMRALAANMLLGVTEGFKKTLEIEGVGYRVAMEGKDLVLNVGYSHPVRFSPPEGITITVEKNVMTVTGIDKYKVGQAAAEIRAIKKPEPYKGKGIRYGGEVIIRKAGKKVAGTTTG